MIERYEIMGVGPIQHVKGELSRFHAFIGPNDSGKSSILRALHVLAMFPNGTSPTLTGWNAVRTYIGIELSEGLSLFVEATPKGQKLSVSLADDETREAFLRHLRGGLLLRLDPDAVGASSPLIPDGAPLTFRSPRGAGLAGICDALLNRADGSFEAFSHVVAAHFPTVKTLRLGTPDSSTKTLEAVLQNGTRVPASQMSEGFLHFVAIAVLPFIDAGSLLFLEEPENGLHPSRIAEVMKVLRTLSDKGTQIIMATHSPLVVNELSPDEVTVVTRDAEKGTQLMPIAQTPNFAERSKVFALGELWLNYANGVDEAPLLKGTES